MLWLIVFGLVVACLSLFQRLRLAERRILDLEERHEETVWRLMALASARARGEVGEAVTAEQAPVEDIGEPEQSEPPAPAQPAVTLSRSEPEPLRRSVSYQNPVTPDEPAFEIEDEPPRGFDFEEIFGRRLPIWAGGITLAVAGVFLVRYSIERGLLTPQVRVFLSFLFGILLLVAGEMAYRFEHRVGDERVRQALAGAGLATLYAAFYLAGTQYALIGQTFAFLGLAAVTALAIFLSYRFGLPSAVLGLLGGFAAPALVGGEDANLPTLSLYLALVVGGLTQTANRQRRSWLGLAALTGGLGWGGLLLLGGDYGTGDLVALGLYFVFLGAVVPSLLDIEQFQQPIRIAAAAVAGLQLALLVDAGGYRPLVWGLYLLLGSALALLGWKRPELRAGSAMAAAIGVVLLGMWPDPEPATFALVATGLALVFAAVPLAQIRFEAGDTIEAFTTALVPLAIGLVALSAFAINDGDVVRLWLGLGLFALAAVPAASAWFVWKRSDTHLLAANLASGGLLAFLAADSILPDAAMPFAASAVALGLTWLTRAQFGMSKSLTALVWLAAIGVLFTVPISTSRFAEFEVLFEGFEQPSILLALRWLAAALPFAAIALLSREGRSRAPGEFMAGLLLFASLGQVLPPIWLVWTAAALAVAIRLKASDRAFAGLAFTFCIALWAVVPVGEWLAEALRALGGDPVLVPYLPSLRQVFGFVLPLAVALGAARLLVTHYLEKPVPLFWAALPLALIVVHTLYKHLFTLDSLPDFAARGLAERTVWQALLLAVAWAVWSRLSDRFLATAFAAAALAHFAIFTLLLHNPLWDHQAVGPLPIANLVLAAYAVVIGALLSLRLWWSAWRRGIDIALMVLGTLGAMTLLRQVFTGTYLDTLPLSQTEDLLRSLVGIVLAIGFLLIGSARQERVWRVGSLVLMTATVIKVFVFDTAGLEGLIRIASFLALGASLIGIGWFYSRQLKRPASEA